jgi:hypothetical protein
MKRIILFSLAIIQIFCAQALAQFNAFFRMIPDSLNFDCDVDTIHVRIVSSLDPNNPGASDRFEDVSLRSLDIPTIPNPIHLGRMLSGDTSAVKSVTIDRKRLNPGSYRGRIEMSWSEIVPNPYALDRDTVIHRSSVDTAAITVIIGGADAIPATLNFGSDETSQEISIINRSLGTSAWTVKTGQIWISLQPDSGSTSTEIDTVTVRVDRKKLSPGVHKGQVVVTSTNVDCADTATVTVAVPKLAVSSDSLEFFSSTTTLTFNITNTGGGILNWTLSDDQPWLPTNPETGSTNKG